MSQEPLATRIGFPPPDALVRLVTEFSDKAGSFRAGLDLLRDYVGASVSNFHECR